MCDGRFTVFVIKGESPSNLRVAEVLEKKNEDLVKVWYSPPAHRAGRGEAEAVGGAQPRRAGGRISGIKEIKKNVSAESG